MRRYLFPALVVMACVPLALVAALLAAAKLPAMDALTLAMPNGFRQSVAFLALASAGSGKGAQGKIDRVLRLDPENAEAWGRRCEFATKDDLTGKLARCRDTVGLRMSADELSQMAESEEKQRNYCAAEDTYLKADTAARRLDATIARNVGRTALECGRVEDSLASLKVAESTDARLGNQELTLDRELLVIAYQTNRDEEAAVAECKAVHPGWKNCKCTVDAGEVKCNDMTLKGPSL